VNEQEYINSKMKYTLSLLLSDYSDFATSSCQSICFLKSPWFPSSDWCLPISQTRFRSAVKQLTWELTDCSVGTR